MDRAQSPQVLAVVVSWNSGRWLPACVAALRAQTWQSLRVLVWDNASGPDTQAVLDTLEREDPQLRVVRCDTNLGFAGGNNAAVRSDADAALILTVNPDAMLDPDCVARMVDALLADAGVAAVGATQLQADRDMLDGLGDRYHLCGLAWREAHGEPAGKSGRGVREIFAPCAAVALYRRSAFDAAGGFDEDFFCYFEDVDLGFRLRLAGHRCVHVHEAVAVHVGSVSVGKESDFALYHGHRNLVWSFVKNMPWPLLWIGLPMHLVLNAASLAIYARRGRGRVLARAKLDALRGVPRFWRKRRTLQRGRRASVGAIWQALDKRLTPP